MLKTHHVVMEALQNRVGQGTADGLTRGLVFLATCIAEIQDREVIDEIESPTTALTNRGANRTVMLTSKK